MAQSDLKAPAAASEAPVPPPGTDPRRAKRHGKEEDAARHDNAGQPETIDELARQQGSEHEGRRARASDPSVLKASTL